MACEYDTCTSYDPVAITFYGSQSKVLERATKAGASTRFGRRFIEKSIENPHFSFCSFVQNLRLGIINFGTPRIFDDE